MKYTRLIQTIQQNLTLDLLNFNQKQLLTGIHPTEGHCAIAAEAAFHLLGGKAKGWIPVVLPKKVLGNNTHWWIENIDTGEIVDPTKEQFGNYKIPYHLGKRTGFMCPIKGQPSKRAKILIKRVELTWKIGLDS